MQTQMITPCTRQRNGCLLIAPLLLRADGQFNNSSTSRSLEFGFPAHSVIDPVYEFLRFHFYNTGTHVSASGTCKYDIAPHKFNCRTPKYDTATPDNDYGTVIYDNAPSEHDCGPFKYDTAPRKYDCGTRKCDTVPRKNDSGTLKYDFAPPEFNSATPKYNFNAGSMGHAEYLDLRSPWK